MYKLVKEIDTYIQEEVVSDITVPEVYTVDIEINTDKQVEKQVIKPPTINSDSIGLTRKIEL